MKQLFRTSLIASIFICTALQTVSAAPTALDEYVALPDENYKWSLSNTQDGKDATTYTLALTSQKWRNSDEVDTPLWTHQLTVIVPSELQTKTALLSIAGGLSTQETSNTPETLPLLELALKTHAVVCELTMVPNQPIKFNDEADPRYQQTGRKEDALVAYGWDKYLCNEDSQWLLRLPMTKSVVRAMDTAETFLDQQKQLKLDGFVLLGISKRGWTAWTTAAVDKRVKGIIPIVIDLLNLKTSFIRHYMAYGQWSLAVRDYADIKIYERWHSDVFKRMMAIIEPFEYRERLTMPKLIINASGDEFFLPDTSRLYFTSLPGMNHLLYLANTGHRVTADKFLDTVIAYLNRLLQNKSLPTYHHELTSDNKLVVTTSDKPSVVKLWKAYNPNGRDFRLPVIGSTWTSEILEPDSNGQYSTILSTPENGWSAHYVELSFGPAANEQFRCSTDVYILPDTYPYDAP